MEKLTVLKCKVPGYIKILFVMIAICITTANCNKDDDGEDSPVIEDAIVQPLNPDDPAVLPEVKTVIQKLEGDFTPLLTGVVVNWRVKSHKELGTVFPCWSDWVETYYNGVTREGIKDLPVYYPGCGVNSGGTWKPDFSAPCSSVWGQYRKGQEIQDGDRYTTPGGTVNFYRYYTVPDLPDAYIMMERRWEVVPIPGEGDYAYCEGCTFLEREVTTTIGQSVERTIEWGYTLGIEYHAGINVGFLEAGIKLSASFNQQFSTSINSFEEHTISTTYHGDAPAGKSIIRLQIFREISTFKLVNKDGGDYFQGVNSPEIQITTQTKNYFWYY